MTITIGDKEIFGDYKVLIFNLSFDEFLEFATEDISCELLDGVLIINSPADYQHESIFRFLLTYLDQFGLKTKIGRALGSRFVVKLGSKWGPEPDIIFYRKKNKNKVKETYFEGSPDIIIEILSPTNREEDLMKKLPKYLEANVPEVWIVDSEARTLTINTSDGKKNIYSKEKNLVKSNSIPEIRLNLEWLWNDDLDPIECLNEFFE